MVKIRKVGIAVIGLVISSLLFGCSSAHERKIDIYGLSPAKRKVDEAKIAKSLGVSYTAYSRESTYIKQYRAYMAKKGVGTPKPIDIWLISRKFGILPSEYIPYLLEAEQEQAKQKQR